MIVSPTRAEEETKSREVFREFQVGFIRSAVQDHFFRCWRISIIFFLFFSSEIGLEGCLCQQSETHNGILEYRGLGGVERVVGALPPS